MIKPETLARCVLFLVCLVSLEVCFFYLSHYPQHSDRQPSFKKPDALGVVLLKQEQKQQQHHNQHRQQQHQHQQHRQQHQQQGTNSSNTTLHPAHPKRIPASKGCIPPEREHMYRHHGCKRKNARVRAPHAPSFLADGFWRLCAARPYNFQYQINRVDFCTLHNYVNLILVIIPSNHAHMRKAIRRTWGQKTVYRNHTIGCLFIIGRQQTREQQELIDGEASLHKDIIQEGEVLDTYTNLTYKMLMGFDWVDIFCPQARYIIKLDEDSQMERPAKVVDYVVTFNPSDSTVLCFAKVGGIPPVIRDYGNKWCVTRSQYPHDSYPEYCAGGAGYAISTLVAKQLLSMSYQTRFFWLEDVYITGILRAKVGGISVVWVQQMNSFHRTLYTDGSKKLKSLKAGTKARANN